MGERLYYIIEDGLLVLYEDGKPVNLPPDLWPNPTPDEAEDFLRFAEAYLYPESRFDTAQEEAQFVSILDYDYCGGPCAGTPCGCEEPECKATGEATGDVLTFQVQDDTPFDLDDATKNDGTYSFANRGAFTHEISEFGTFIVLAMMSEEDEEEDDPNVVLRAQSIIDRNAYFIFAVDLDPTIQRVNKARLRMIAYHDTPPATRPIYPAGGPFQIMAHCAKNTNVKPFIDHCPATYDGGFPLYHRTATRVTWNIPDDIEGGQTFYSEDIACVINEVINRVEGESGWESGNDIMVMVEGCEADTLVRVFDVWDDQTYPEIEESQATKLELWWLYYAVGDGGLVFSGSAPVDLVITDWEYEGTGGLILSGTAGVVVTMNTWSYTGTGGLVFGGVGTSGTILEHEGSGGLIFSGTSPAGIVYFVMPTGGLIFSGNVEPNRVDRTLGPSRMIFDNGFYYRKLITIPAGKAAGNLEEFPVKVSLTIGDQPINYKYGGNGGLLLGGSALLVATSFKTSGSGGLLLNGASYSVSCNGPVVEQKSYSVTPSGGLSFGGIATTKYALGRDDFSFEARCNHDSFYHDVESFNAITGELVAWVRLPLLLEDEDNLFYCYYGNESGPDNDPQKCWKGYEAVYHLVDWHDSTVNDLDGTTAAPTNVGNSSAPTETTGIVASGQTFDGNDYLVTDADDINVNDNITIEAWVKPSLALNGRQVVFARGNNDLASGYGYTILMGIDEDQKPWARVQVVCDQWQTIEVFGDTTLEVGEWVHLSAVWTSGQSLKVLVNGVEDGTTAAYSGQLVPYSGENQIGRLDVGQYYRGDLDELRLTRFARSEDWLVTTYRTASDPYFHIVGDQEHAMHLWGCPIIKCNRVGLVGIGGLVFSGSAPARRLNLTAQGEGGLSLSGSAKIGRTFVASGGLELGSTAPASIRRYDAMPTGGLALASSASFEVGYRASGKGGLDLDGSATIKRHYRITAAGQLAFSGTSAVEYVVKHVATVSGGLAFGGSAQPKRAEGGGMSLSGSAKIGRRHRATGGLRFGGTILISSRQEWVGTGGLRINSTAPASVKRFDYVPSGGLQLSGSSQPSRVEGGRIQLSGSATVKGSLVIRASGGLSFGSSATVVLLKRHVPTGGLDLDGSAKLGRRHVATGGVAFSGSAKIGRKTMASGGLSMASSSIVRLNLHSEASGGMSLSGQAGLSTWYVRASGGLQLNGSATATTPSFRLSGSGGLVISRASVPTDFGGDITLEPVVGGSIDLEPSLDGEVATASVFAGQVTL